jgi:hypothetical protein
MEVLQRLHHPNQQQLVIGALFEENSEEFLKKMQRLLPDACKKLKLVPGSKLESVTIHPQNIWFATGGPRVRLRRMMNGGIEVLAKSLFP